MVKMISPYGNAVKEVNSNFDIQNLEKAGYKIFEEEKPIVKENKAVNKNDKKATRTKKSK